MSEWFETSKIALGIDLATSAALIASAIGLIWRITVLSRKIQEKQIESQKEASQKIVAVNRERARIDFLLSTSDELSGHILELTRVFVAANKEIDEKPRVKLDEEIRSKIRSCWHWMQHKESRFIAIGTSEQITKLQRAQRHFIGAVDLPTNNGTNVNPKEMVVALKNLQKEILVDIRAYLFSESKENAMKFVEGHIEV